MQECKQTDRDVVVLNIRLRGRAASFAAATMLVGLLPFVGTSAAVSRDSVTLAAGARAVVPSAADAVAAANLRVAHQELASAVVADVAAAAAGARMPVTAPMGGGEMAFPGLDLPGAFSSGGALGVAPGSIPINGVSFMRPVDAPESSGYGPRIHPVLGREMFHTGVDLAATCNTPIRSVAAGTVVHAAATASWGNRVIIEHSPGLQSAYGHQSVLLVKVGDVVGQGDVIGLVGTTGWSTGCHLHFDVILDKHYVDPAPYLGLPATHAGPIPYAAQGPGTIAPHVHGTQPQDLNRPVQDGDVPVPVQRGESRDPAPATRVPPSAAPSAVESSAATRIPARQRAVAPTKARPAVVTPAPIRPTPVAAPAATPAPAAPESDAPRVRPGRGAPATQPTPSQPVIRTPSVTPTALISAPPSRTRTLSTQPNTSENKNAAPSPTTTALTPTRAAVPTTPVPSPTTTAAPTTTVPTTTVPTTTVAPARSPAPTTTAPTTTAAPTTTTVAPTRTAAPTTVVPATTAAPTTMLPLAPTTTAVEGSEASSAITTPSAPATGSTTSTIGTPSGTATTALAATATAVLATTKALG